MPRLLFYEMSKEIDVERESIGQDPKAQSRFRERITTALRVMRVFVWGLCIVSYFGSILLTIRMPQSHWRIGPELILFLVITLSLFRKDRDEPAQFLWFLLCLCLIPLYPFRSHEWVPPAMGALFAAYFWLRLKSTHGPCLFMVAGALLAGVLPLQVPWPNVQRCLLTLVSLGLTAILQGVWIIIRYLQGHRPELSLESAASSSRSSGMGPLRIIKAIFGAMEQIQIFSPELEQRIRSKYISEVGQLTDLGFDYLFSYGEAFSLFRLVLIFPAMVVVHMWCKGEVVTVHEGTKFMVGHPVFMSRSKTAFAEPSLLGVKFYTVFQDGYLLISKNYDDRGFYAGPTVAKYAQKANISDTWANHQKRIDDWKAEGKRVDCQTSFDAYSKIGLQETAF